MTRKSLVVRGGLVAMLIVACLSTAAFAAGPSEGVLYSFPSNEYGASLPEGNLVADSAGNLYGTAAKTVDGAGLGFVFELVRPVPPSEEWTLNVLYSFTAFSNGAIPTNGVIFDGSGNLYGTTYEGGTGSGVGVIFELTPPAIEGEQWTETVLYSFQGSPNDGEYPSGGLVFDSSGNLYGVTSQGGEGEFSCEYGAGYGCGVVFELTPPTTGSGEWTETVIHYFDVGKGGEDPVGAPILDGKGILYGVAHQGGSDGDGVVYRLAPPSTTGGVWNYAVLHNFAGSPTDGAEAYGSLTMHGDGLYGTTVMGGQNSNGTVFELTPPAAPGGEWTDNILHSFGATSTDGTGPAYNVIFDKTGNLYGITGSGGGNSNACAAGYCGTVYELSPPATQGANWTETILHSFPANAKDGSAPYSGLLLSTEGALYGVTAEGGAESGGTVYGVIP
jgi:hypothetical protein